MYVLAAGSTTTIGQVVQFSVTAVAAVLAGVLAWGQLGHARKTAQVERTLALHRDLSTGDVVAARDRFTEFMWFVGSEVALDNCHQPTFEELLGPRYLSEAEAAATRDLSAYPTDMVGHGLSTPPRDLYKMLWCFERIVAAFDEDTIDRQLFKTMLAHHIVWWDTLLARITDTDTRHREPLRRMAAELTLETPDLGVWATTDFTPVEGRTRRPG